MTNFPNRLQTARIGLAVSAAVILAPPAIVSAGEPIKTGEIRIYGNEKIKTYIIRRQIPLRRGAPFDSRRVDEARSRIRQIPGVDYSEVRVNYTAADSSLALNVVVTEKSTFRGFPIVERGYENLMSFGGGIAEDNFRGRSESIGVSAMFRGGTVLSAAWENPWLGQGPRIGVGLDADYADYLYVYDDLEGLFEGSRIRSGGVDFSLFYTFGFGMRAFARLGYRRHEGDAEGVTIEPGADQYGLATIGIRHDGRSSRLYPWSGWLLQVEASGIGPGDDAYSILAGAVDARVYLPVFARTVFGLQFTSRVKDGDRIPIYLREHLGGGLTVRGYDYGSFNGVSSALTSAEFRIPINFSRQRSVEDLLFAASLHLFVDAGATWELDQTPDSDLWHSGFGVGILFLNSWTRGIRFDYGWNANSSGRLDVEIGSKF
jgi:outer membrane protein insertion porin family